MKQDPLLVTNPKVLLACKTGKALHNWRIQRAVPKVLKGLTAVSASASKAPHSRRSTVSYLWSLITTSLFPHVM